MLGVMHAHSLSHAIELQNAVAYGLTAGLYTQNPDDLALWLDRVQAGNLYVNRGITGAIVQRQPFGGWKRSSVGAGTKAGGPNYLIGLGRLAADGGRAVVDAAPAGPRLPHRGADRGGAALAGLRRVRLAAPGGAVGCRRLGPRVRPGAGCLRPRRRAQPVPVPAGAGGPAGDGRRHVAGAAARRGGGRAHPLRVHPEHAGRAARRGAPGAGRARHPRLGRDRRAVARADVGRVAPAAGAAHRLAASRVASLHAPWPPRWTATRTSPSTRTRSRPPAGSSCSRSCTSSRSRSPRTASATPTPGAPPSSDAREGTDATLSAKECRGKVQLVPSRGSYFSARVNVSAVTFPAAS